MDKYTYNLKVEKIQSLVRQGDYESAARIADTMDFGQEHNVRFLETVADAYEHTQQYTAAIDILLRAYQNAAIGKRIMYRLCELAIQAGQIADAETFYKKYLEEAPDENNRYILRYEIAEYKGEDIDRRIQILETYRKYEFDEKWAYRLAELYQIAGRKDDCVALCDEIILWFGVGSYVEKAMKLKEQYEPLTAEQEERRENRSFYEAKVQAVADEMAAAAQSGAQQKEPASGASDQEEVSSLDAPESEAAPIEEPAFEDGELPAIAISSEVASAAIGDTGKIQLAEDDAESAAEDGSQDDPESARIMAEAESRVAEAALKSPEERDAVAALAAAVQEYEGEEAAEAAETANAAEIVDTPVTVDSHGSSGVQEAADIREAEGSHKNENGHEELLSSPAESPESAESVTAESPKHSADAPTDSPRHTAGMTTASSRHAASSEESPKSKHSEAAEKPASSHSPESLFEALRAVIPTARKQESPKHWSHEPARAKKQSAEPESTATADEKAAPTAGPDRKAEPESEQAPIPAPEAESRPAETSMQAPGSEPEPVESAVQAPEQKPEPVESAVQAPEQKPEPEEAAEPEQEPEPAVDSKPEPEPAADDKPVSEPAPAEEVTPEPELESESVPEFEEDNRMESEPAADNKAGSESAPAEEGIPEPELESEPKPEFKEDDRPEPEPDEDENSELTPTPADEKTSELPLDDTQELSSEPDTTRRIPPIHSGSSEATQNLRSILRSTIGTVGSRPLPEEPEEEPLDTPFNTEGIDSDGEEGSLQDANILPVLSYEETERAVWEDQTRRRNAIEPLESHEMEHCIFISAASTDEGINKAIEALDNYYHARDMEVGQIAKILGEKLNRRGLRRSLPQLGSKDLIIDKAGALSDEMLRELLEVMEHDDPDKVFVLLDTPEEVETLKERVRSMIRTPESETAASSAAPQNSSSAADAVKKPAAAQSQPSGRTQAAQSPDSAQTAEPVSREKKPVRKVRKLNFERIDAHQELSEKDFIRYADYYANEIECVIDDSGFDALESELEDIRREDGALTAGEVREIVEDAAEHANKATIKRLFSAKYDKEGFLILRRRDFI